MEKGRNRGMNENMYHMSVLPFKMSNTNVQSLSIHHRAFFRESYKPLNFDGIQDFPNPIPIGVREQLPRFSGKKVKISTITFAGVF